MLVHSKSDSSKFRILHIKRQNNYKNIIINKTLNLIKYLFYNLATCTLITLVAI